MIKMIRMINKGKILKKYKMCTMIEIIKMIGMINKVKVRKIV